MPDPEPPQLPDETRTAFAQAFAEAAPALHAWAHLRVRGELRARLEPDDLVQEIAVRSCQRADDYDPARGTFRQWLFGFANRVWLEVLRELGRDPLAVRRRRGGDSQLPGVADTVTAISQRVARDDALQQALARLHDLPDDDRRLLACIGLEGLPHGEAATILGIAADTCRKRWQRLRERLQQDQVLRELCAG